jgi:hypothetical protein
MSDVIDFLERMGQDAQLRDASQEEVELALADAEIESSMRSAILGRDTTGVQALLGQVPMFIIVMPSEEPEEEEEEEEGEGEGDTKSPGPEKNERTDSQPSSSITISVD